jgi:hypothetical protein
MEFVGTVQNGRHKSNQLNIFSHLIKLHGHVSHVHHNTLIDHIPQESVAGHDYRVPQSVPFMSLSPLIY